MSRIYIVKPSHANYTQTSFRGESLNIQYSSETHAASNNALIKNSLHMMSNVRIAKT